ncbi:MAG: carbohydrate ABC transporter permease [Alphaproteobacteria bacterium]|nr:carbohydrate ABC transporter permease [Alphaproteobacteria bacterium]
MRANRLGVGIGKTAAVAVILLWSLFPIAFMALSSLKPAREIFAVPPTFAFVPTLEHYTALLVRWPDFFRGLWNSLIVTVGATVLTAIVSTMAGYAYSRFRSPALTRSASFLVAVRLLPPIVLTLPLFPLINWLGLSDTHFTLIVLYATFFVSLGTLLMRAFVDKIPVELDEAALVDGAGRGTVIAKVIAPLALPGMLALSVFVIVFAWNEFLFAFVFTSTRAKTAPLIVSEMLGSFDGVDWGVLFAAATIQLLPILIFVCVMQRHLVAGLTSGATKG